jgi:rhamnulokinase
VTSTLHAAVDLGASSGRVVVGEVGPDSLRLEESHRFPNGPVRLPGGLHWDVLGLYAHAVDGLARAQRAHGRIDSVGVDSWAVDYGLLDASGALLGNPFHYRDRRTDGVADRVHEQVPHAALYAVNGLQLLPFNTCYQLAAAQGTPALEAARTLLLVPDLLNHWLGGVVGAEATNASTTGLLDARTREWSDDVCAAVGVDRALLPALHWPGDVLGPLLPHVREATGIAESAVLTAVGSHDTASAVVGVPMEPERAAYISLGTWGLVGLELEQPVLTEASRAANFTNELGVDGRVRYLRNVMGLWLLQESLRTWNAAGEPAELPRLLDAAAALPAGGPTVDVDDPRFLPPGDMPARLRELVGESGGAPPASQVEVVRCVVDSLAVALARAVRDAARLSGREVEVVHVVGGGAQNALLCQLTADACGLPVVAGPVEATAIGNVLVQARAVGTLPGDVDDLRALVRATQAVRRFAPRLRTAGVG